MQNDIENFAAKYKLNDSSKEELIDLVNVCFTTYVKHMSAVWLNVDAPVQVKKEKAVVKTEKLENASDAESLEQLVSTTCTTTILNDYCRKNGLRIGGKKSEIASRVWRHIQGEAEDDDISPRSKPKKVPAKKESHQCFACNAKGQPCGLAADNEHEGEWFCFRHIDSADEIIEKKNISVAPSKAAKASPKKVSKKPSASLKKKTTEHELEEEDDE